MHTQMYSLCFKKLKESINMIRESYKIGKESNQIYSVWDKNKEWSILSSGTSSDNHING